MHDVTLIPGDGIGPSIADVAVKACAHQFFTLQLQLG
jgi:isocitrate/isopropylmalate dehydrogenase